MTNRAFRMFCTKLEKILRRKLTVGERTRARNWFSNKFKPESLAEQIVLGRRQR